MLTNNKKFKRHVGLKVIPLYSEYAKLRLIDKGASLFIEEYGNSQVIQDMGRDFIRLILESIKVFAIWHPKQNSI